MKSAQFWADRQRPEDAQTSNFAFVARRPERQALGGRLMEGLKTKSAIRDGIPSAAANKRSRDPRQPKLQSRIVGAETL
jgi:hypothetical protein